LWVGGEVEAPEKVYTEVDEVDRQAPGAHPLAPTTKQNKAALTRKGSGFFAGRRFSISSGERYLPCANINHTACS